MGEFNGKPIEHKVEGYGVETKGNLEAAVKSLNRQQALRLTDKVKQLDSYISWQKSRIENWKQQPLTPVKE